MIKDKFGRDIEVGSLVAITGESKHQGLSVGIVNRLSEYSIWVDGLGRRALNTYNIIVLPKGYNRIELNEL